MTKSALVALIWIMGAVVFLVVAASVMRGMPPKEIAKRVGTLILCGAFLVLGSRMAGQLLLW